MTGMQRQPTINRAGHCHGPNVPLERDHGQTFGAGGIGIGTRAGHTTRIECLWWPFGVVYQRPEVAAHPAHVGTRHRKHGVGGDCSVDCRTTVTKHVDAGLGGKVVDGRDHGVGGVTGDDGSEHPRSVARDGNQLRRRGVDHFVPVERITPTDSHVVVEVGGTVVADTTGARILYETNLPPRYYLPLNDVHATFLTPTDTSTHCPYKGDARYWTVTVDGIEHTDIVWGYDKPIPEAADIGGFVSFYPAMVNLTVDGTEI